MQWLRRSFITGFFVTVPLFISIVTFIWIFEFVDGLTTPLVRRLFGRHVPGVGIVATAAVVVAVGAFATNVIGKRLLQTVEGYLLRVPVFRTIYAPGQAARRGLLAGQRVRFQAGRHAVGQARVRWAS